MKLEAASELRVLAVKLNRHLVLDYAFKLNGGQQPLESPTGLQITRATNTYDAIIHDLSELWSNLQRQEALLNSTINNAESIDALFMHFVLALQPDKATHYLTQEKTDHKVISRAEEYLRAHLTRSVSRGFTKRWGTGPMDFLKTQRMEAVYRELLGVTQGATSVTEVACRHGFTHLGKFAGEYKQLFHESPSETLHH